LTSVIGEDELSDLDKKYISFGHLFEEHFINQGFDTNRSIEETLDLGWNLVSVLPREALDRLDNTLLDQYYNHEKAIERFNIKEKKIIKELQEEGE
jgi:V/A-type H+-transporting ATPase subunit B